MPFREPAPDGSKGPDNLPLHVLTAGTLLKNLYKVKYLTAGGMSILYTASRNDEQYLIKEVEAADSKNVLALTQEKFILERLNHPGIVKVYDIFEQDSFYYMVLEYIEGESMEKLISHLPSVFIQEKVILNWALQICDIFEYLHKQSPPLIYRDLKPRNLLKDRNGKVHLIDFGIARVYKQGKSKDTEAMGSAMTASPEHYGGAQTDTRSDIYTIGATLHFFVTNGTGIGDEPFRFAPVRSINPKISENMEQVIKKCLEHEPRKRYQSVREMRQALLNSRDGPLPVIEPFGSIKEGTGSQHSQPDTPAEESDPTPESHTYSALSIFAIAAFCIIILFGGVFAIQKIFESGNKSPGQSGNVSPVALVTSIPSGMKGTPVTPPTPDATTIDDTTLSSSSTPSPVESQTEQSNQPYSGTPATIAVSTSRGPSTPAAPPTRKVEPPPLPGGTSDPDLSDPFDDGSSRPPGGKRAGRKGEAGGLGRLFGYRKLEDISALPIVRSDADPQAGNAAIPRLYRDESNGYQIVLRKGWIVNREAAQIESHQGGNIVGAFSHNPPSIDYPITAIIVRVFKAKPGITDPQVYLQEWISADESANKISRLITPSPRKESAGSCERAASDMVVRLRGKEVLQTRLAYMDSKRSTVTLIKCYFRAKDLESAEMIKELEAPVIDSFSFTDG